MTEDPLSLSDQTQNWKTHVTVSLWDMKRGVGGIGTVRNRWAEDGGMHSSFSVCVHQIVPDGTAHSISL